MWVPILTPLQPTVVADAVGHQQDLLCDVPSRVGAVTCIFCSSAVRSLQSHCCSTGSVDLMLAETGIHAALSHL